MKLSTRRSAKGARVELAMTSMIDVIFLLLIFFLLNLGYHSAERELESTIRVQSRSKARSHLDPVVVEVTRGNGAQYVYKLGGREFAALPELTDVLARMKHVDGAFVRVRDDAPFDMA